MPTTVRDHSPSTRSTRDAAGCGVILELYVAQHTDENPTTITTYSLTCRTGPTLWGVGPTSGRNTAFANKDWNGRDHDDHEFPVTTHKRVTYYSLVVPRFCYRHTMKRENDGRTETQLGDVATEKPVQSHPDYVQASTSVGMHLYHSDAAIRSSYECIALPSSDT